MGKNIAVNVEPTDKIGNLKPIIVEREGYPADEQRYVFEKAYLEDEKPLLTIISLRTRLFLY